ncbi:hypothetical protein H0H92_012513 [Tricholoma furcatifolium]|nr:hypothetical protein H0H92_012513 [Tricholoma furcatifolium]
MPTPLSIPHPRKWFKKSKKVEEPPNAVESSDVAMSELAESLQQEIQGLTIEIKRLRMQREHLFRPKSSTPCLHRHRSTQSLWFPITSVPPIPENNAAPEVEMGLFGPRSRVSSFTGPSTTPVTPEKPSSPPVTPTATVRRRSARAMSQDSVSSTNSKPASDSSLTPTRTAWRVVEKKFESVYLARAAAAPAPEA